MFLLVYYHMIKTNHCVFISLTFISTKGAGSVQHVALPCFYSSSERTNKILALEMAFHLLTSPENQVLLQAWKGRIEWMGFN